MRLSIQFSYDENGMTYLFPSPLGEMGLSMYLLKQTEPRTNRDFRPLSGKWGYRFATLYPDLSDYIGRFPSPLGEMGLSICQLLNLAFALNVSFRPLSGKWGYRYDRKDQS